MQSASSILPNRQYKKAAQYIAAHTNAAVFEIEHQKPFTSQDLDWTNVEPLASRLHSDPDYRDVPLSVTTPSDWNNYDVVYLGYPFCASSSSPTGNSAANLATDGNWQPGQPFPDITEDEITHWLDSLQ